MNSVIKAVQTAYYGDAAYRTPPPDLESLLLKERIVYLGLPLFSSDDVKRNVGVDVTELIIAQLLYLQFDDPEKPIFFYINSTGTSWYTGDAIGYETEAFAICDTLNYIKPPVHTICIGLLTPRYHRSQPKPHWGARTSHRYPDSRQRSNRQQTDDVGNFLEKYGSNHRKTGERYGSHLLSHPTTGERLQGTTETPRPS